MASSSSSPRGGVRRSAGTSGTAENGRRRSRGRRRGHRRGGGGARGGRRGTGEGCVGAGAAAPSRAVRPPCRRGSPAVDVVVSWGALLVVIVCCRGCRRRNIVQATWRCELAGQRPPPQPGTGIVAFHTFIVVPGSTVVARLLCLETEVSTCRNSYPHTRNTRLICKVWEKLRIPTFRPSNFLNAAPPKSNRGYLPWSLSHLRHLF